MSTFHLAALIDTVFRKLIPGAVCSGRLLVSFVDYFLVCIYNILPSMAIWVISSPVLFQVELLHMLVHVCW